MRDLKNNFFDLGNVFRTLITRKCTFFSSRNGIFPKIIQV